MDDGPWLYYKLTNEPKGSGELIIHRVCNAIALQIIILMLPVEYSLRQVGDLYVD